MRLGRQGLYIALFGCVISMACSADGIFSGEQRGGSSASTNVPAELTRLLIVR